MNLQRRTETIIAQDEVLLNTQGLMHKVGGVTLKGSAFTGVANNVVKSGTAIMLESASGMFVPYADNAGAFPANAEVYILAQDTPLISGQNPVSGAFVKAYLNESKLTGVTAAFKAATNQRYIFG